MSVKSLVSSWFFLLVLLFGSHDGGLLPPTTTHAAEPTTSAAAAAAWQEVDDAFQNNANIAGQGAFLIVGDATRGRAFASSKDQFKGVAPTSSTVFRTASLVKMMTGVTILQLHKQGIITSLEDHPQKYLSWWNATDLRSQVTIRQLLSFTSGFYGESVSDTNTPACTTDGATTIDACAQEMYQDWFRYEPGTTYVYGPTHHQILGAIAQAATGGMLWSELFQKYVTIPLNMTNTIYNSPSLTNPRLDGGADSTAEDVERLCWALIGYEQEEWGANLLDIMAIDGTPTNEVIMEVNPFSQVPFHYGASVWLECFEETWEACVAMDPTNHPSIISATGGLGFHAYIDRRTMTYGILATESTMAGIATFQSLAAIRALRPLIDTAMEATPTTTTQDDDDDDDDDTSPPLATSGSTSFVRFSPLFIVMAAILLVTLV